MLCFGKHRCWLAQESSAPKPFVPRQGRRNTADWVNRQICDYQASWGHGAKGSKWCFIFSQAVLEDIWFDVFVQPEISGCPDFFQCCCGWSSHFDAVECVFMDRVTGFKYRIAGSLAVYHMILLMAEILHQLIGSFSPLFIGLHTSQVVVWDFSHQQ